jgi:hypothetical protein
MAKLRKRFWRISLLFHGVESVIGEVPITHITETSLLELLKMLFAKHTLTDEEILACQLRANVKRHRNLIRIQESRSQDPISFMISDGSNWVNAIVVRPEDE